MGILSRYPRYLGDAQETQQKQQKKQQTQGTKEGSSPSIPLCPSHPIFFTPKPVFNPSLLFAWLANAMLSRASFSLGPASSSRLPPPSIAKFRRRQPDHGGQMDRHQHQQRSIASNIGRPPTTTTRTQSLAGLPATRAHLFHTLRHPPRVITHDFFV
ncbi:hypothetical protein CKAH01_08572 [Colletotrichum kahawae]|uniref:Uncharacterized protein n=1 Tax=Colletotrichum kahawae TaxID=34407 RepID=A0AAE0D1J2_COLKA|nr:hypothetical protein CKAH01_08572 [Colletotrichum kahawae]